MLEKKRKYKIQEKVERKRFPTFCMNNDFLLTRKQCKEGGKGAN